jgi:tetratricopeptide (TPR) repeat protein
MRFFIALALVPIFATAQKTPEDTPDSLNALAAQYRSAGRLADADAVLDRLVVLAGTVENVEKSARVKAALGQFERAGKLYERALELRLDADLQPAMSIPTRRLLVSVLLAQKKFGPATQQAFIAIALRSRSVGADHPDLAGDHALLARVYQTQRMWDQAARAWEEVLRIQSTAFGEEDVRLTETLDSLAACQGQLQLVPQAEATLRRALSIREVNLGPTHTDVAHNTDELGQLLHGAARYAEAEPFFRRSLDIYTTFWGPGNPQLARSLDNIAVTEAMLQKFPESAGHYAEALKIRDGENALNLHHLALVQTANGKPEVAEQLYRRLLALLDVSGNENPDLRRTAATEFEALRREIVSKQAPKGPKSSLAAKQK